jgi:hypothetical protein
MALVLKDRVKETSTSTGTATITLAGSPTGFRTFNDIGNGNTTYYTIVGNSEWEVGLGTYTASGTTLSRDTVLSNSLGTTALINFSAGSKDVFVTYPSGKAILGDTSALSSTGTGSVVLSDSPTFTTKITTPAVTAPTTDLTLSAISTGAVKFSTLGGLQGQFNNTASTVNYFDMFGSATTKAIQFKSNGSDTNISMAFQPKGTGAIDLAAGSSGVNISNGGTVTAITRTNAGVGYTTAPTWSASAPTTSGGTSASGTATLLLYSPVVNAGGTGYTVGDTLTIVGGTFSPNAAQLTVSTVSSGVITAVTILGGGTYTATPTYPASVTGGTGTGATFTMSAGIASVFPIVVAGSGYIEQPTVTFSGGGGTGAAAYAIVGSAVTVKGLHGNLNFATSGGTNFAVLDSGQNPPAVYPYATGGSSSAGYGVAGSATNAGFTFTSKGTSAVSFYTNSYGSLALQLSHTASAVNYVQVTGSATGGFPSILTTGSDASVGMSIRVKGTPSGPGFRIENNSGANPCFAVTVSGTSIVNYMRADPSVAGAACGMSSQGTDTDIDLSLTPKGAGAVRFGAYTAGVLTPTGYITIKDSGGTTRRLLVG